MLIFTVFCSLLIVSSQLQLFDPENDPVRDCLRCLWLANNMKSEAENACLHGGGKEEIVKRWKVSIY
jgi:hypothetical protein